MLKIKVNLDEKSYVKILNDMSLFKILKKDGSINKNKFMNLLFENYYQHYQNITKKIIDKANIILKKYELNNLNLLHDLANEIYETEFLSSDEQYNKSLTFYLDEHNEFIFNNINTGMFYQTASAYFRNLITSYLMLPEYKRECIIYLNVVEKIQTAIKNKNFITIELDKRIFEFAPYKIATTKEELYSYLIGCDKTRITVIHISKIKNIMIENKSVNFTNKQKHML